MFEFREGATRCRSTLEPCWRRSVWSYRLGEVVCDHTSFNPTTSATLLGGVVRRMGTLATTIGDTLPRSLDVVAAGREDYQQRVLRGNRTQCRMSFTIQNPELLSTPNYTLFDCTPSALTVTLTYLAP